VFDHKNLAVDGLFPGLATHMSIANLGSFGVQVIIEPVSYGGGGGYVTAPTGFKTDKYRIRIIVTRKGKRWSYERIVSTNTAKVIAKLAKIELNVPSISVGNITVNESAEPVVKVTHVNRKT